MNLSATEIPKLFIVREMAFEKMKIGASLEPQPTSVATHKLVGKTCGTCDYGKFETN